MPSTPDYRRSFLAAVQPFPPTARDTAVRRERTSTRITGHRASHIAMGRPTSGTPVAHFNNRPARPRTILSARFQFFMFSFPFLLPRQSRFSSCPLSWIFSASTGPTLCAANPVVAALFVCLSFLTSPRPTLTRFLVTQTCYESSPIDPSKRSPVSNSLRAEREFVPPLKVPCPSFIAWAVFVPLVKATKYHNSLRQSLRVFERLPLILRDQK